MADSDRATPHGLIERLRREPYRFDFYQALRLIECAHPEKPRIGTSQRPADDPIRLCQTPEMDFAPTNLQAFESGSDGRADRLTVRFLGLFGSNGPLPLHLTEYARERLRHHNDPTFVRFADIFHHRMLSLFYRAWANAEPTVQYDRPESDRFAAYVASTFGIGDAALRDRDAMPDAAKLHFAGLLSCQTKHPDGLAAIIDGYLNVPARIVEFVGEWMDIPSADLTRLGATPLTGTLGHSAVAGARVWGCQHKFRIVLGPLSLKRYQELLPGGALLAQMVAIVRNYLGDELVWDMNLILRHDDTPPLNLDGGARLGWTTWLGSKPAGVDADELLLNPFFRV